MDRQRLESVLKKINKLGGFSDEDVKEKDIDLSPILKAMDSLQSKVDSIAFPRIPEPERYDYSYQIRMLQAIEQLSSKISVIHGIISSSDVDGKIASSLDSLRSELLEEIEKSKKSKYGGGGTYQAWNEDFGTFDGTTNTVQLRSTPKSNSLNLYLNGVKQLLNSDYSVTNLFPYTLQFTLGSSDLNGMTWVANYPA